MLDVVKLINGYLSDYILSIIKIIKKQNITTNQKIINNKIKHIKAGISKKETNKTVHKLIGIPIFKDSAKKSKE